MNKTRILTALALLLLVIAFQSVVAHRPVVESAVQFGTPLAIILAAKMIVRRSRPGRGVWFAIGGILLCIIANLSQLVFHGELMKAAAFGVTMGVMLSVLMFSGREGLW